MSRNVSRLITAMILLLASAVSWAGTLHNLPFPEDGDKGTNSDDRVVFKTLDFYDGGEPQFLYEEVNDQLIPPALNDNDLETGDILGCIKRAIETWNGARFGSRHISTLLNRLRDANPYGSPFISQLGASVDGVNIITFRDEAAMEDDQTIAVTIECFFIRDYDISEYMLTEDGKEFHIPSGAISGTISNPEDFSWTNVDINNDGTVDIALPVREFEAGEVFDIDIAFNPSNAGYLRAWPEDEGDVPSADRSRVMGSLDIQMIMTHQLGWVQGLARSLIVDSVMYPYFDGTDKTYPSDPYRRRNLAFDDEMTAGLVHGSNFDSTTCGSISGNVLEGSAVDGAADAEDSGADEFVIGAPVFVCMRPEQLAETSSMRGDGYDTQLQGSHPDDVESNPALVDSATRGVWRRVAHVMSGTDLKFAAGSGIPTIGSFIAEDDENETQPGGNPDLQVDPDADTTGDLGEINSSYSIPGLAEKDDADNTVDYAVQLGSNEYSYPLSILQAYLTLSIPETYPEEFYGGPMGQVRVGNGTATDNNSNLDSLFENAFISVELNQAGRLSASINEGPAILSGFGGSPRSFVVVDSPGGTYSNRLVSIGQITQAVQIDDVNNMAQGLWTRSGDFSLKTTWKITDQGGNSGIASGILVTHVLTNVSSDTQTYSIRQVLDTYLFGRENPVYVANYAALDNAVTLSGASLPAELHYQTSLKKPAFSGFVTIKGNSLVSPDYVTVASLEDLGTVIAAGEGEALRGYDAMSKDTGVALVWDDLTLVPGDSKIVSYIVGFMQPGELKDTWLPFTELQVDDDNNILNNSAEDDPDLIEAVQVTAGEVTDNVDIITNTGTALADDTSYPVPEGSATGELIFLRSEEGFPQKNGVTMDGKLGDFDNDGDLDVVTCGYGSGDSEVSFVNRLYFNEQRIEADGSTTYYFRDVTFGDNGLRDNMDDRLPTPGATEKTVGVVAADFDGDGDLDLFFTNEVPSGDDIDPVGDYFYATTRFYENLGPEKPGYFQDISQDVLPGLLNRGWGTAGGRDNPWKAAAGDIDSDGDLDIIISQALPFDDSNMMMAESATCGWSDAAPRDDKFPAGDGRINSAADVFSGALLYAERVLINQINNPDYAPYERSFQFRDETLGADDRVGTLTSLETERDDDPFGRQYTVWFDPSEIDRMPPIFPIMFTMASWDEENGFSSPDPVATKISSPMGARAVEPHLGPMCYGNSLDLFSVRQSTWLLTYAAANVPIAGPVPDDSPEGLEFVNHFVYPATAAESGLGYQDEMAVFRNVDLFSTLDGSLNMDDVPDGYFFCFNYNADFGAQIGTNIFDEITTNTYLAPGCGLFAIEEDEAGSDGQPFFRYDAFPLFVGMPDGHAGDFTPSSSVELDVVPRTPRGAWAGFLGDWEYRGAAHPLVFADNDGADGPLPPFTFSSDDDEAIYCGAGMARGQNSLLSGLANAYWAPGGLYSGPYAATTYSGEVIEWPLKEFTPLDGNEAVQAGEPRDMTAGDFDLDGDTDIFVVTSSDAGLTRALDAEGQTTILGASPVANQLFINDGFGNFTDISSGGLLPNTPAIAVGCDSGDIDNDGDLDLVVFNFAVGDEIYLNQAIREAPDVNDEDDPTMFFDGTVNVVPPVFGVAFNINPGAVGPYRAYSGVSYRTQVGDLNGDGRPDVVTAEGGVSSVRAHVQLFYNSGNPLGEAVKVLRPGGAAFPAPHVQPYYNIFNFPDFRLETSDLPWSYPFTFSEESEFLNGYMGEASFYKDVALGDADGDGDLDMLLIHTDNRMQQLLFNVDNNAQFLNSVPDDDDYGDGIFVDSYDDHFIPEKSFPDLVDPFLPDANLKHQGQRAIMCDLDNNGYVDIVIANGDATYGAPNVVLLNQGATNPGKFWDYTDGSKVDPFSGNNMGPALRITEQAPGIYGGLLDNTRDMAVGDFDHNGYIDVVFANQTTEGSTLGFRLVLNQINKVGAINLQWPDSFLRETEGEGRIPLFAGKKPRAIVAADFDGLGEPSEDANNNGIVDPGEDGWINGQYYEEYANGLSTPDWIDLPTETEDANGNGQLDAGEDGLIGDINGVLDQADYNGDGIYTYRRDGRREASLDLYISFEEDFNSLLINDPTNIHAGYFSDQSSFRFADGLEITDSRGVAVGDIDLDGDLDIVVAMWQGGLNRLAKIYMNTLQDVGGGYRRLGYFKDISHELPYLYSTRRFTETVPGDNPDSYTGWANDVDLLDLDGDGDLDIYFTCLARPESGAVIGSLNAFFFNRVIGDGFNKKDRDLNQSPGNPVVASTSPSGSIRGFRGVVTVYGTDLSEATTMSFGQGITVASIEYVNSISVKVTIEVAEDANLGPRRITAQNPSGASTQSKLGIFTVYEELSNPYKNGVQNRTWLFME